MRRRGGRKKTRAYTREKGAEVIIAGLIIYKYVFLFINLFICLFVSKRNNQSLH